MSTPSAPHPPHPTRRQLLLGATAAGAASLLAACGGGGGAPEEVPPPPTGGGTSAASFGEGPIAGFGSIIVAGVRYDDSAATVQDEDGAPRDRGALKLGSLVEVEGGRIDRPVGAMATAVASRIVLGRSLLGPVGAIDTNPATGPSLTVLGQVVLVTASTVFDDGISGGLAGLAVGDVLEVHALYDPASQRFTATRIERKPGATAFYLRGRIRDLDTTAKTFVIGTQKVSYASVPPPAQPWPLADGVQVRVQLQPTQVAGAWVATRMAVGPRTIEPRGEAEIEGVVTKFTSLAAFEVNGLSIQTSAATQFPDGTAGVVAGARVEVRGTVTAGVLAATVVRLDEEKIKPREFELNGAVSAIDATAKTFVVRGVTVSYGGSVEYRNGTEATLANGRVVEVKGVVATDKRVIAATRISFK
jgi:hypothetical protein